eukprot:1160022-Pelagomonas_calceolata.AAC.8
MLICAKHRASGCPCTPISYSCKVGFRLSCAKHGGGYGPRTTRPWMDTAQAWRVPKNRSIRESLAECQALNSFTAASQRATLCQPHMCSLLGRESCECNLENTAAGRSLNPPATPLTAGYGLPSSGWDSIPLLPCFACVPLNP